MDKPAIKKGSVVWLNSGGPALTVSGTSGDFVSVVWMDDDDRVCRAEFPEACLATLQPKFDT